MIARQCTGFLSAYLDTMYYLYLPSAATVCPLYQESSRGDRYTLAHTMYWQFRSSFATPSLCTHCLSRTSNFGIAKSSRLSKTICKGNQADLEPDRGWELQGASGACLDGRANELAHFAKSAKIDTHTHTHGVGLSPISFGKRPQRARYSRE